MPTWSVTLTSVVSVIIILAGALNFPYVPMLFGVYGSERHSAHGKLLVRLIWLFPPIAIVCIYLAWTSNSYISLLPFIYIGAVWSMRANKSHGTNRQYYSKQENLSARMSEVESRWDSWQELGAGNKYILFSFYALTKDDAIALKSDLSSTEKLHSEIELSENSDGTLSVYARILINTVEKQIINKLVERANEAAWNNKCELLMLDVMEDSD